MRFLVPLLLALAVGKPVQAAGSRAAFLPPPVPRPEPRAFARAPLEERRPVELLAHGRAWAPLVAHGDAPRDRAALGGAAGVGFRTSPYFSFGAEGSVLRVSTPAGGGGTAFELAAVGRVYLLEAGALDPYLELALGYSTVRRTDLVGASQHGPSTRAGGGFDLVAFSPLRLGVELAYREVLTWPGATCELGCRARVHGGFLAGIAVTLPLGEPL